MVLSVNLWYHLPVLFFLAGQPHKKIEILNYQAV